MLDGLVQVGGDRRPSDLVATSRWDALRPRFATVYLENRCHLACGHCYESESTHPRAARLSLADYDKLFDELAVLGVLFLSLTGGEIFLRRDLLDIVTLGRKKRFAVRLYTSGTLIDDARADKIHELKVSEVQVSLYSADPATHDAFVGRVGAHQRTVRALRMLQRRRVLTVVKTLPLDINIEALEPLADLAESLGADFRVDPLLHPRMNGDASPLCHRVTHDQLKAGLLSRARLFAAFRTRSAESLCSDEAARSSSGTICAAARDVISIAADGSVLPCASFPVSGGNVRERSVIETWRRSALFDQVRATTFGEMGDCQGCAVKASCDPCMAYALIEHGDRRRCNSTSSHFATALRSFAAEHVARVSADAPSRNRSFGAPQRGCGCGG